MSPMPTTASATGSSSTPPGRRPGARPPTPRARPRGSPRGLLHAMKPYVANASDRERNWLVVDATGQTLGRLATQIADALRGKRSAEDTPPAHAGGGRGGRD